MSDIQVYNDYFDPNYFNHLKGVFTSQEFPWYYNDCVVDGNEEDFQFIHILYKNNQPASQFYNQLEHGIKLLKTRDVNVEPLRLDIWVLKSSGRQLLLL